MIVKRAAELNMMKLANIYDGLSLPTLRLVESNK